jgi:1L-myo-inositol 1-phosphate cytidylyltransferase
VDVAGGRILGIGKNLPSYNGFDTGVFAIGPALFEALDGLDAPSLTQGMQALIDQDLAFATDCGDLHWIDVDDAAALSKAESWWSSRKL